MIDSQLRMILYFVSLQTEKIRQGNRNHAKLRIDNPKGELSGSFPIVILDGAKAFMVHEHLTEVSNMLVILDRSEYQEGIHDTVLGLRSISGDDKNANYISDMPDKLAPGIELAAYWIDE